MGRSLLNTVLNMGLEGEYGKAVQQLGYKLEDLGDSEQNAALGNGGLGRLAACFLDSIATLDLPGWGYGIRYKYGMFKQVRSGKCQHIPPCRCPCRLSSQICGEGRWNGCFCHGVLISCCIWWAAPATASQGPWQELGEPQAVRLRRFLVSSCTREVMPRHAVCLRPTSPQAVPRQVHDAVASLIGLHSASFVVQHQHVHRELQMLGVPPAFATHNLSLWKLALS